jgi:hypothetical protein
MAKYQVTIEFTTRLSREVDTASFQDAEQDADKMFQEYLQGQDTHIVGTEHHRSVDLLSGQPTLNKALRRFRPVGP